MRARAVAVSGSRLDQWLVAHGQAASREEAQAVIMAGAVTVDGQRVDKPGRRVGPAARVALHGSGREYASRGGLKLAHALATFGVSVHGRTAVDLGASTGGFTDCLLRHGAAHVYAVDVGRGQLVWRLRTDPRVTVLDEVNARYLDPDQVGGPCDLVTVDLAFISLRLVWGAITRLLRPDADVIALVKPQFEAGRSQVGRGGVVRDPVVHASVLRDALEAAQGHGLAAVAVTPSPVTGPAGNIEYLVHLRAAQAGAPVDIAAVVADAHARLGRPGSGGRHPSAAPADRRRA
jgi:23S rRNA (cytidine1920-2'-O)/16S rRNA (cytidine1409-2'-O)-methyltransferase